MALEGLLGNLGNIFNADNPSALYGGLLSDPATQRSLAWRGLMGATQKAGELAMPTRMPLSLGAVLGQVGGAIGPAEDAAIKARSEEAAGLLSRNQAQAFPELIKAYQNYNNLGGGGGGTTGQGGTGTAAPGTTAPASPLQSPTSGSVGQFGWGDVNGTQALLNGPHASLINAAAQKYNLPPNLIAAQINAESSGQADLVSPAGAVGLMQVLPTTANLSADQLKDPATNIDAGAAYLAKQVAAANGDYEQALKLYHGGPDQSKWGDRTNAYPGMVFARMPKTQGTGTEILTGLANGPGQAALPAGYKVVVTSGERPGATVKGTGGPSQHGVPGGNAIDIKIIGPDGNPIPGHEVGQEDTTGLYGKVASAMRGAAPLDVQHNMGWGGNFGERDNMHVDLGGNRGQRGRLASAPVQTAAAGPPKPLVTPPPAAPAAAAAPGAPVPPVAMPGGFDPSSAAPPRLPPGVAPGAAPGPAAAAAPPAAPGQVALNPAAQAIAAGMQRAAAGGVPSGPMVAGPGAGDAAPPPVPPVAAPNGGMPAGMPNPMSAATPAPLVTPPPAATPVPPPAAPPMPATPPMPALPAPPSAAALPAPPPPPTATMAPNAGLTPQALEQARQAQQIAGLSALLKIPVPDFINQQAALPFAGQKAAAEAAGRYPFEIAQKQFEQQGQLIRETLSKRYETELKLATEETLSGMKARGELPSQMTLEGYKQDLIMRNELAKLGAMKDANGEVVPIPGFLPTQVDLERAKTLAQEQAKKQAELQYAGPIKTAETTAEEQAKIAALPQRERITALQADYNDNVSKPAQAAYNAMPTLIGLQNSLAQAFRPGTSAQTRQAIAESVADGLQTLGFSVSPEMKAQIAAGQIVNKFGNTLGFEMARTLGSREAASIVQQAIASNPSMTLTPEGNEKLINLMMTGLQREMDRRTYYDQWFRAPVGPNGAPRNSYDGAWEGWLKDRPMDRELSQVVPYANIKGEDDPAYKRLSPGTQYYRAGQKPGVDQPYVKS